METKPQTKQCKIKCPYGWTCSNGECVRGKFYSDEMLAQLTLYNKKMFIQKCITLKLHFQHIFPGDPHASDCLPKGTRCRPLSAKACCDGTICRKTGRGFLRGFKCLDKGQIFSSSNKYD